MPRCAVETVHWNDRPAYRISNGNLELTVLLGGGHIVDLRSSSFPANALWEAPWTTIDPQNFSSSEHSSLYGDGPVGRLLSGYSGHALVLPYFGMPSENEEAHGLALHGEAATSLWEVTASDASDSAAHLSLDVQLTHSQLHVRRQFSLAGDASAVRIAETLSNRSNAEKDIQWVQHCAFGEPLLANGESSIVIPAGRGITWPLGYEDHALLPDSCEFNWPHVKIDGEKIDLSSPFAKPGTGFVAALLLDPSRTYAFAVIHNRRLGIVAGYVFDRARFPWVALWEENRVRTYPPWNGITRVRGVEFGTTPLPLGLEHALMNPSLFNTPVSIRIAPRSRLETNYELFIASVPQDWRALEYIERQPDLILLYDDNQQTVALRY